MAQITLYANISISIIIQVNNIISVVEVITGSGATGPGETVKEETATIKTCNKSSTVSRNIRCGEKS